MGGKPGLPGDSGVVEDGGWWNGKLWLDGVDAPDRVVSLVAELGDSEEEASIGTE